MFAVLSITPAYCDNTLKIRFANWLVTTEKEVGIAREEEITACTVRTGEWVAR
jgi:hypothetical protein